MRARMLHLCSNDHSTLCSYKTICIALISGNDHRSSDYQLVSYYSCFCYRTELNVIILYINFVHYVVAYSKLLYTTLAIVHGKLMIHIIILIQYCSTFSFNIVTSRRHQHDCMNLSVLCVTSLFDLI